MSEFKTFGYSVGEGKLHEEIIYTAALVYNIIHGEISTFLRQYDLTTGKLNVLLVIRHQGGEEGISQVDVSKHLIVTPSNMTKMIDKLEKDGMVVRLALEGDRRVNILRITKMGADLLDKVWPTYNELLKKQVASLNKEKQQKLSGLLTEWFNGVR